MPRKKPKGDPAVAVAYLRVSTDKQELGPDAQRAQITSWASREGVRVAEWYEEHITGKSGLEDRTELMSALAALRVHGAGVLVAAKRDRLARDVMVTVQIEREIKSRGAVFRSADGASDGAGPEGEMMRGVIDVFAQYERQVIIARTKAALAAKRARGGRTGTVQFGYDADAEGRLSAAAHEQAIIDFVLGLRESGMSLRQVVDACENVGHVSRTHRPLRLTQVVRIIANAKRPAPGEKEPR